MNYGIPSSKATFVLWMSQKKKKREKNDRKLKEKMAENIPNLGRDMAIQGNEAHRFPKQTNLKRSS